MESFGIELAWQSKGSRVLLNPQPGWSAGSGAVRSSPGASRATPFAGGRGASGSLRPRFWPFAGGPS
eukprot:6194636-Pleurochrysis_carterae.AAC.7